MNVGLAQAMSDWQVTPLGKLVTKPAAAIESSRFSVGVETLDRGMWNFEANLPNIAKLGAKWARVQTGWGKCEQTKGVYDLAWLDAIVDPLLAAGVRPWFNVGYGNKLYLPDAPHPTAVGWTPIRDAAARDAWAAFCGALAAHFKGRVDHFEIWNEPDISAFWTPYESSGSDYADLVKLSATALKTASPEAQVVGGAVATALRPRGFAFIEEAFEHGLGDHIDAFSYHLYQATPDRWYVQQLPTLKALVHRYRPGLPLWQGESGAPSQAQEGQALSQYEWDEPKQAKWFLRRTMVDLAGDAVLISFFHAADFEFYIVKDRYVEKHYYFGLLGEHSRPKPAFWSCAAISTVFAGEPQQCDEINCEWTLSEPQGELEPMWFGFETAYGPLVAYWQPHDMMQPLAPQTANLALWMPRRLCFTEPVLIDPVGLQVYPLDAPEAKDGFRKLSLPLVDWPLWIVEKSRVEELLG